MKDLNIELAEMKQQVKDLKAQRDIEINMKNNMYNFILINGLMKELLSFDKKYPLEVAVSSRVPFIEYSVKVEAEEKQLEKSIS